MKKRTLGFKLVAGGVIAVLVPLLVVGIFAAVKASGALETAAKERALGGTKKLADLVQETMAFELKVATVLAMSGEAGEAANGNAEPLGKKLAETVAKVGKDYEAIAFIDANGSVAADGSGGSTKGISLADRPYFIKAKEGKASVGAVVKSRVSGNPITTICVPVMKEGTFGGALAIMMKLDSLAEKVTAKMGETGYGFMTDQTGLLIAHPDKANVLALDLKTVPGMEAITKMMLDKQAGVQDYVFKGIDKIAGVAPVPLTGWSLCITQDADEFLSAAHAIRNFIVGAGLLFLSLTVLAVVIFAGRLSRPIQNAVDQMGEAANQVAAASTQVSSASQSLAEGASEQASAIEETSSSLEEMSSMTKQNAGNASEADGLMKQTNEVVRKANEGMGHLTHSMQDITAASEETSKIIKTIDEIAFQTNLLALNAAVEAARAGEAGAGFAVVADEVRNLAMRAAEAAKSTASLIEGTVKKIKEGSALVNETNEAFGQVSATSAKVGELVSEIAAASKEQSQGIDQINKAVAEMDKVIQQTAANAEESASASEELNAQAEQMKGISASLNAIIGGAAQSSLPEQRFEHRLSKKIHPTAAFTTAAKKAGAALGKRRTIVDPKRLIPLEEGPSGEGQFKDF
ncbi:MAG: methyl-accepting chemotaxis protein [Deltaproteobacteria bacterium]|nr:methyl-accepting chemotaxis protein [Deltaproteobacteria bacterium]